MPTYYELNREHCLIMARLYRNAHKEEIAKRQAEYYQKVNKARRAFGRRLYRIEHPKPPKPEPAIKTTTRFLATEPVPKNPKKPRRPRQVYPDLSTIRDFTPVSSGKVEFKPGVVLDWNNL